MTNGPNDFTTLIELWEPHIQSFVDYCPQPDHTKNVSESSQKGILAGCRVGVKDIIDVAGMPTRNGSSVHQHANPALVDAPVVAALRAAGAEIVGKTTTTEFAFTDPTNCRNPYDIKRTPGGSSSGSGAAVSARLVELAIGTQTAGSLCRPAAYCGVVGFKPSYGTLSTTGVAPLAPSFDTIGLIARSINLAWQGFSALSGFSSSVDDHIRKIGSFLLPTETSATDEMLDALIDAGKVLQHNGYSVQPIDIDLNVDDIVNAHRTIMLSEAAAAHASLLTTTNIGKLQPGFRAALIAGTTIKEDQIEAAQNTLLLAKLHFWTALDGVDCVVSLPVPDGAPLLDGTTGFQDWLTPWTVFGGPLVCLPWGLDSLRRPRSIMIAARPGHDLKALLIAKRLERWTPPMPRPRLPVDQ